MVNFTDAVVLETGKEKVKGKWG